MSTLECILCLDNNDDEHLVYNNRCSCKYYYHVQCWSKIEKNRCIMCNIDYNIFFIISPLVSGLSLSGSVVTQQPIVTQQQQPQQQQQQPQQQPQQRQQRQQRQQYLTYKNEYVCYILIVVGVIIIAGLLASSSYSK
jgi:hypothetical protein